METVTNDCIGPPLERGQCIKVLVIFAVTPSIYRAQSNHWKINGVSLQFHIPITILGNWFWMPKFQSGAVVNHISWDWQALYGFFAARNGLTSVESGKQRKWAFKKKRRRGCHLPAQVSTSFCCLCSSNYTVWEHSLYMHSISVVGFITCATSQSQKSCEGAGPVQKGLRWSDRHHKKKQLDMEDRGFLAARSNRRHFFQIPRLN